MINIESIKDYIDRISEEELTNLLTSIYNMTDFICKDYPNYKEWFFNKQLKETIKGNNRNILFVRNPENKNEIIGVSCLKKNKNEQKICTLYVQEEYRGLKIGSKLIEESMKWLNTTKPLITISDYKLDMFKPIIDKYNWELTKEVNGIYSTNHKELCFNEKKKKI